MPKLIGNAPNQVPTNADLGSMAFEDKKNYATTSSPIYQPYRNIIINGDMSIAQRGTSASIGNGDTGYHTVDRYKFTQFGTITGEFTQSQSTDVPTGQGFAKSLKMDCTTADTSLGSDHSFLIDQRFEGQNLQYLKKGTASAESLTVSFWVKSSKIGTYICEIYDRDNIRGISKAYTINTADTWEKKTLTFAGDTTGTLGNDNGDSLRLHFWLGAGSDWNSGTLRTSWGTRSDAGSATGQVNLADSTANEWYITGIQLEAGTTASDFEFLPHDVNLQRCQRYYQIIADRTSTGERMAIICGAAVATGTGSGTVYGAIQFPTPMRASATLLSTTVTNGYRLLGDTQPTFNVMSASPITNRGARLANGGTLSANATSGKAYVFECELNGSDLRFSSEL
jgi:hypothetical protein